MRQIATDLSDEGGKTGRIELQLKERRPGNVGVVLIAVREARSIGKRIGIAQRHSEPESDKVLKRLCRRQRPLSRQGEFPLNIIAVEMKPMLGSSCPI
jgi:hypothetical protein